MSFDKIMELRNKRATLVAEARGVLDAAEAEKRELGAEERAKYDTIIADVAKLKDQITREENQLALENEMRGFEAKPGAPAPEAPEQRTAKAFRNWLVTGNAAEYRSLQSDIDAAGGYLSAPEQYMAQILKTLDDLVFVRQHARLIPLTHSDNIGVPTLTDPSDPTWTTEIAQVDRDNKMAFGKRNLRPEQLSKEILVSMKLLETAAIPADTLVQERLAHRFAITLEYAFLNGTGTGQPLGVFTASDNGVPTSRDFSIGNTATAITGDGLLGAKYGLKQQYRSRNSVRWCFHRDVVREIAKLKDNDGRYLWMPGLVAGQPDTLLNIPIDESEYAPAAMTPGSYVGILADWSFYWIAELHGLEIQRLVELYAATSQIGFIGRGYWDGQPVMPEAFARVTLAAE